LLRHEPGLIRLSGMKCPRGAGFPHQLGSLCTTCSAATQIVADEMGEWFTARTRD